MRKYLVLLWAVMLVGGLEAKKHSCDFEKSRSAEVFSSLPQRLLPREAVLLERVGARSLDVDLSLASTLGMIVIRRSGTYKIVWHGQKRTSFHPTWTLGFSLDGEVVLGNIYGPSEFCNASQPFDGSLVLSLNAGQAFRFVNASAHPVELIPDSSSPPVSFALSITLFEPIYFDSR